MSDADFDKISKFIYNNYGIKLPAGKKTLVESRLQKRLRKTGRHSFKDYMAYVFTSVGAAEELIPMVNAITTNKTDFFRGSDHFDFLSKVVLPDLSSRKINTVRAWSAACSTGQEPYTLAMVLHDYKMQHSGFDYSILGTDLSTDVLAHAVNAVYSEEQVADIPLSTKVRYLLRSKNRESKRVKIVPALREKMIFSHLNLMDDRYNITGSYHVIFCRNVLIYFDRATQERVINKLTDKLHRGGYLFIGHSESLTQMNVTLRQVRPTIFQKP